MGDLAKDTEVTDLGGGRFGATLSEDWRIWGPNGGYLASVALRAAGAAAAQPRPASIAVHFLGVADFADVELTVTELRATRRAQSLRVSMTQGGAPVVEALVWAVADGIEPLEHDGWAMPDVAPATSIPTMEERLAAAGAPGPPFPFWDNIDNRGLQWRDDWPPPEPLAPEARWWCRFRPAETFADRWVDACRSLVLVDTFGWPVANGPHAWRAAADGSPQFMAPTIDVHCAFHAFEADEPWLLVDGHSPSAADGLVAARVGVFAAGGRLLASGGQTMLARRIASAP